MSEREPLEREKLVRGLFGYTDENGVPHEPVYRSDSQIAKAMRDTTGANTQIRHAGRSFLDAQHLLERTLEKLRPVEGE